MQADGGEEMCEADTARFVHTWVPEECEKLMIENLNKVRTECRSHEGPHPWTV